MSSSQLSEEEEGILQRLLVSLLSAAEGEREKRIRALMLIVLLDGKLTVIAGAPSADLENTAEAIYHLAHVAPRQITLWAESVLRCRLSDSSDDERRSHLGTVFAAIGFIEKLTNDMAEKLTKDAASTDVTYARIMAAFWTSIADRKARIPTS